MYAKKEKYVVAVTKDKFIEFCKLLYTRDLVSGVGGNISAKVGDRVFITPTGFSLIDVDSTNLSTVDMEGKLLEGAEPSKDLDFHLEILMARPEVKVVCHVHGAQLIALSTLLKPGPSILPPLTPGFVYLAYPVAMIPFHVPGSKELRSAVKKHFTKTVSRALMLKNHGLITIGKSFQETLSIAEEIEEAARIWLLTNGNADFIDEQGVKKLNELYSWLLYSMI